MKTIAGTRFFDWIDFIGLERSPELVKRLESVGFTRTPQPGAPDCFVHHGAMFPAVVLSSRKEMVVGIKVDSAADFASCWRLPPGTPITGEPFGQFRTVLAFTGDRAELVAVERHGYRGFEPRAPDPARALRSVRHLENLRRRRRDFADDAQGFAHARKLVEEAITDLGADWACDLFFQAEREYWGRRNRAAQVQKARQDRLGLGWANHDHHTYRCSRRNFTLLIGLLELMGFRCRERFYAGAEAGWGAQVVEQPVAGITIFADVDMSPEELLGDFAHTPMVEREALGTIGLWCALHGEAMLQAGMHHLECQFDWHALKEQLEREAGIKTMDPFTTFPFLRQAFTEGERWVVSEERLARLLASGQITGDQAELFRTKGALGSHLENLERNDGFKGFNQQGVSAIISKTDPRKQAVASGA